MRGRGLFLVDVGLRIVDVVIDGLRSKGGVFVDIIGKFRS